MAKMAEGVDETHSCSICLEDFTKPKILPCFHTFCQHCIDDYIKAHSHLNKFNCPNCRTQIQVPDGGASGFSTNFYIQPKDKTQNHFCRRHKTKEIEFYCRDCSVAVCGSCVILDHTTHSKTDLTEIDQEVRGKLNIIKGELEGKIDELEKHCELLTNQISDIKNQAKKACDNIDQQVQRVCDKIKKHGIDIKCEMNKIRDEESKKLQTLHEDMTIFKSSLQTSFKYINDVLNGKSTVKVVDALTNVQTLAENSRSTTLDIPTVKYVYYPMVNIDGNTLKRLLGEVQTMDSPTWTSSFSLNQIVKTDENYYGDDVIIQGMIWHVFVRHQTDTSGLGCYVWLRRVEDKTVKTVTASFTLKLLNINDLSKSLVLRDIQTFKPGGYGWGSCKFRVWNKLEDETNGFIDNNKTFSIQASVKIKNIERY
ncbi:tripartite motif-containing protein 2-like [Patella vulgata]|uniref:tripartite motif-containing protein 2-like n=1 Tax=Patella vulgata TaxID=6465 RepID=UPI0024A8FBC6|nr:tripartite motif-containing protein 2-like [Patella vulgata]